MNTPSGFSIPCYNTRHKQLPTQEQRRDLIRGALEFANLFPLGDERSQFLEIAQSLSFFAESVICLDESLIDQPSASRCGQLFSIVRGPDNVIDIKMPPALLGEIKQWAKGENLLLSDAIRIWVKRAVSAEGIGCSPWIGRL
jgi:hypothetical protein